MYFKYVPIVFLEDKRDWESLEEEIYNAYHKALSSHISQENEDINPEEIPF